MAASEEDIIRDQNERDNLQRVIASAESAIADSAPGTSTRRVLENLVEQAKRRIVVLEKKIEESTRERETEAVEQVAMAARLAEKEAKLSEQEKETFSGFLAKEFFTKKDFGKLENFYAHTWDRLSEGGKEEMSHRVWEGIRHGEYRFHELPRAVREKEEDRLYANLTTSSKKLESLEQIPEADRNDFIQAYKAGNRDEAGRVLNRDGFRSHVSLTSSAAISHTISDAGKQSDDQAVADKVKNDKASTDKAKTTKATVDYSDINLDGANLQNASLADASSAIPAVSLPNVSAPRVQSSKRTTA